MATFPPRVFGYRPCLCDHETHVKRAKKWRHNAKQAYLKMVESPLVSATIMVDFKKMQALFENEEKDNDSSCPASSPGTGVSPIEEAPHPGPAAFLPRVSMPGRPGVR